MKLNDTELRELDAWIAIHVFGWHELEYHDINHSICKVCGNGHGAQYKHYSPFFHKPKMGSCPFYTTDPAAAFALQVKLIEFAEKTPHNFVKTYKAMTGEFAARTYMAVETAPTLEIALCLLAKQVFTKGGDEKSL